MRTEYLAKAFVTTLEDIDRRYCSEGYLLRRVADRGALALSPRPTDEELRAALFVAEAYGWITYDPGARRAVYWPGPIPSTDGTPWVYVAPRTKSA